MHSNKKGLLGMLVVFFTLALFSISCAESSENISEQEIEPESENTIAITATINETINNNEIIAPSPTPEPPTPTLLNGEQLLLEAIATFDAVKAYRLKFTVTGDVGNGTADCYVQQATTQLCEQNVILPGGESDTSLLLQFNNSSWHKNNRDEEEWRLIGNGFKQGYAGLNDFGLVQTVNAASEQVFEDDLIYEITFNFEPESLLALILNDESAAQAHLSNATSATTEGIILINAETMQPLQETVLIQIESESKPLSIMTEIDYFWNESVEIEPPLGEQLLQVADEFMMTLRDGELENAYALFSTDAKSEISQTDFYASIQANNEIFADYESLNLLGYERLPETTVNVDREHRVIIAEASYENQEPANFRFIFSLEDESWKILRFDTITLTPSSQ